MDVSREVNRVQSRRNERSDVTFGRVPAVLLFSQHFLIFNKMKYVYGNKMKYVYGNKKEVRIW